MSVATMPLAGTMPAEFSRWERELARIGNCAHPIHLRGAVDHVDVTTGEILEAYSTDHERGGVLLKRCGSRLAAKCPACAWTYQQDAYQLLKAGLSGGKGMPESINQHPRLFVTLTAPSFGEVHTREVDAHGRVQPCHPRSHAYAFCPHGRRLDCRLRHREDDPRIGEPLCSACYRYEDAVVWNAYASELWTRTIEYTYRELAPVLGVAATKARTLVHLEYAKVAEWQARGQIHFHAVIRLDAVADGGALEVPVPPDGLTVEHLKTALKDAITNVPPPDPSGSLGWGDQIDFRDITAAASLGEPVSADKVAGYLAKYATKATEAFLPGITGTYYRTAVELLKDSRVRDHVTRLVRTALELGKLPGLERLRRHAKTLGYGGHFLTKSRRYSTTLTELRAVRVRRARSARWDAWDRPMDPARVEVVSTFTYAGAGHASPAEREAAITAATRARERRRQRWATRTAAA